MIGLFYALVLEITQRRVKMQVPDYHPAFTSYLHVLNPLLRDSRLLYP
jgi:hypothetical protein